ncbi:MAG: recombinase family protein [Candidatus Omnitrophota bacterium]|jgi:site-specific DNA recombinase
MRAIIYCRVSTKEQTLNLSLPTQKKACLEYCHRNGFEPDEVFVDEGESAKTAARPEFQKMLRYCRENKGKIHYLIVYSLSRFSRNTHDHLVIRALLSNLGISLRSVTELIDNSSAGKLMETILAGFAQFDNDVKSERTKAGMKAAMEKGRWPYIAPLGYVNENGPKGQSNIKPDPERAPLIQKAFELYSSGKYTRPALLNILNNCGLKTRKGKRLSLQTFESLLRNPLYAGFVTSKLIQKPERGNFEPLISEELFNAVQALIAGKKPTLTTYLRNHPDFPLRVFVTCKNCGRPLTGSWSKGRNKKYPYYRCPNSKCKQVNVRKYDLETAFIKYLEQFQPKKEFMEFFKAVILDCWKEKQAGAITLSRNLRKRVDELETKREKLIDAFIYKELIDQATYEEQKAKLDEDIKLAEIEAHSAKLEAFDVESAYSFATHILSNAARLWSDMNLDQKQRFQKVLFPQGVYFLDGEFGTAETCIFFNMLQESAAPKSEVASPTGFEPVLPE